MVNVGKGDARFLKTIADGGSRKTGGVFYPIEALFLHGGD
jgi:hypothetical protein